MVVWSGNDCCTTLRFWNCQHEVCEPTATEEFAEQWSKQPTKQVTESRHLEQRVKEMIELAVLFPLYNLTNTTELEEENQIQQHNLKL